MSERTGLMTVGDLAARTGLSIKAIRELEGRGLIFSAGRSPANYRLFDESALWCVQAIRNLRSLGLTISEIEQLAGVYLARPNEPFGPHLGALLDKADSRIDERIEELELVRDRIRAFRAEHAAELGGAREPARRLPRAIGDSGGLDPPPGVRP